MERVQGARTPYEVYCFHCRVTFPAEARRCLHCGGPLFGSGERPGAATSLTPPGPGMPIPRDEDAEEGPGLAVRRFGQLAIWAIVALAAVLQNVCNRGPA
jgi:hypothetical protein